MDVLLTAIAPAFSLLFGDMQFASLRQRAAADQLKAEGWIPQDFTPAGSKSSSTTQTETKAEPPADNQAATSETKEPPKTENKTVFQRTVFPSAHTVLIIPFSGAVENP